MDKELLYDALAVWLVVMLLLAAPCGAEMIGTAKKVVYTEWLKQETLKWGTMASLCTYQAFNGLVDGYHFRQEPTYMINGSNYHAFVTGQRLSGIATGWFMYANFRDKNQKGYNKVRRLAGASLIGRNCFEWGYRGARYGNPFEYSADKNQHSIVYFGFRDGKFTDLYIGTGPISGPAVDIACLVLGLLLFR